MRSTLPLLHPPSHTPPSPQTPHRHHRPSGCWRPLAKCSLLSSADEMPPPPPLPFLPPSTASRAQPPCGASPLSGPSSSIRHPQPSCLTHDSSSLGLPASALFVRGSASTACVAWPMCGRLAAILSLSSAARRRSITTSGCSASHASSSVKLNPLSSAFARSICSRATCRACSSGLLSGYPSPWSECYRTCLSLPFSCCRPSLRRLPSSTSSYWGLRTLFFPMWRWVGSCYVPASPTVVST
mmetsp:Transcript_10577/g.21493  ORF Transcript_10577/g.21493 Transcript_10577/m.21493 type:complete len:241 (+) Transcript_10577:380-1102(+)